VANYQSEFEKIIKENVSNYSRPKLLLHSCCAPCSSYALECLLNYFEITVFSYNPNVFPQSEMILRASEQERFLDKINQGFLSAGVAEDEIALNSDHFSTEVLSYHGKEPYRKNKMIKHLRGSYEKERFYQLAVGLEEERERGKRCYNCYKLRLGETAKIAKEQDFDYFATTLTVSPLKDAKMINELGYKLQNEIQVKWLPSDFKKKNGYQRSLELSKQFGLYRQNYCGCEFSLVNDRTKV
jgi:predicted adenine nucleotide alpha hydrolase (AANH) superfamily ATPase